MKNAAGPVVVGVDGSEAARAAAVWAVAEAHNRCVPLRLVSVVEDDTRRHVAEDALRLARGSVEDRAVAVSVEDVILYGKTSFVLLEETEKATMICLGTAHRFGAALGPTATAVAQGAHCTVAIIRAGDDANALDGGVITVVLDDDPDNDAIVCQAMKEGRLRHATVRQVDRRLNSWVRRFPDVHVVVVAAGTGGSCSRPHDQDLPELAVLGHAEAARLAGLVTPNCHSILGYPNCSMLFVHNGIDQIGPLPAAPWVSAHGT